MNLFGILSLVQTLVWCGWGFVLLVKPELHGMNSKSPRDPERIAPLTIDATRLYGSLCVNFGLLAFGLAQSEHEKVRRYSSKFLSAGYVCLLVLVVFQAYVERWKLYYQAFSALLCVAGALGFFWHAWTTSDRRMQSYEPSMLYDGTFVVYQVIFGLLSIGLVIMPEMIVSGAVKLELHQVDPIVYDVLRQAGMVALFLTFASGLMAESMEVRSCKFFLRTAIPGVALHVLSVVFVKYLTFGLWNKRAFIYAAAWAAWCALGVFALLNFSAQRKGKANPAAARKAKSQ